MRKDLLGFVGDLLSRARISRGTIPDDLNLRTNPTKVLEALKQMDDYVPPHPLYGVMDYSYEKAIEMIKGRGFDGCVIYGKGGVARYLVSADGSVKFSSTHCGSKVEKAKELGFEIR